MIVTPVCAHTLAVRPLVVPADVTICAEPSSTGHEDLLVSFDGQVSSPLSPGDRVNVRRSPVSAMLVRMGDEGYFTRMRQKLNWGDLSGRART
jgi:NAD+ kinase